MVRRLELLRPAYGIALCGGGKVECDLKSLFVCPKLTLLPVPACAQCVFLVGMNSPAMEKWLLCGQQAVAKYKEEHNQGDAARNTVSIYMLLLRLPTYTTDIVLTFNDPEFISQHSSSMPQSPADAAEFAQKRLQLPLFKQALATFAIHDFGLFGQDPPEDDEGAMEQ